MAVDRWLLKQAQAVLRRHSFYSGAIDGIIGPLTILALKRFQDINGLPVTGALDAATLELLGFKKHVRLTPSAACRDLVKHWEGIRDGDKSTPEYDPYICPALVVTIGFGHAIKRTDGSLIRAKSKEDRLALEEGAFFFRKLFQKSTLTLAECEALLLTDLIQYAAPVAKLVRVDTRQEAFDALVSFAFNVGPIALKKSTLFKLHQTRAGEALPTAPMSATELRTLVASTKQRLPPRDLSTAFTAWSHAGHPPQFMSGLFRRRLSEYYLYAGMPPAQAIQQAVKAV